MHEVSIAIAIVEQVEESAESAGGRVHAVHVRIGALSGIVPDALLFAWELATEGTLAFGAELVIERIPLKIRCARCGEQTVDGMPVPVCPLCGTPSREIVAGRELAITALEVFDADPIG